MVRTLVFVAIGGALGALARYGLTTWVYALIGRGFPWGTLVVNVSGSIAMGVFYVLLLERVGIDVVWRAGLMVGLLGAFTTFSAFSIETVNLIEGGEPLEALANALASVVLCVAGCWVGLIAGRAL